MMWKTPLRTVLLMACVLAVLAAGGTAAQAGPAAPVQGAAARTDDYLASLEPVQGLVQVQPAQTDPQSAWQVVRTSIPVSEGDRIRTGRDGLATLTFFEGVDVQIQAETVIVISTLLLPAETDPTFNISVDVLVGSIVSDIQQIVDPEDRFEVHTPGATSSVRGTRWWTTVTPDGRAVFAVERGTVTIVPHHRPSMMPMAAAPQPGGEESSGGETSSAAVAETPPELTSGMGVLTDRYGEVMKTQQNIQFPPPVATQLPPALPGPNCGDGICGADEPSSCPVDCLDKIALPSCGNSTCEPGLGEDILTCGADCGPWPGDQCGNGTCDPDESDVTCPADCRPGQYFSPVDPSLCGNGTCDPTESTLTCPADCPSGSAGSGS